MATVVVAMSRTKASPLVPAAAKLRGFVPSARLADRDGNITGEVFVNAIP